MVSGFVGGGWWMKFKKPVQAEDRKKSVSAGIVQ
jgi:hypothetical protein